MTFYRIDPQFEAEVLKSRNKTPEVQAVQSVIETPGDAAVHSLNETPDLDERNAGKEPTEIPPLEEDAQKDQLAAQDSASSGDLDRALGTWEMKTE